MKVLFAAVMAAAVCLVAGLAASILTSGGAGPKLLNIGIVILMATPVLRVILAVVEFARARDWVFAATALAVLMFLALSVVLSTKV